MSGALGEVRGFITELIREKVGIDAPGEDTDLIESGLLDSLALVTLIVAIEEAFACELPLDDFDVDHFRSVERIVRFLHSSDILSARTTGATP